ncbi:MAG: hypothetical protein E6R03_00390 [Hyphomicrobiaceae bacterium]|nr:MAG: hypothetical protein E6R03_00390 [Hyphomicrobiaceae bacterium]
MLIVIYVDPNGIVERVVTTEEVEAVAVSYRETSPVLTPDYSLPVPEVAPDEVKKIFESLNEVVDTDDEL